MKGVARHAETHDAIRLVALQLPPNAGPGAGAGVWKHLSTSRAFLDLTHRLHTHALLAHSLLRRHFSH